MNNGNIFPVISLEYQCANSKKKEKEREIDKEPILFKCQLRSEIHWEVCAFSIIYVWKNMGGGVYLFKDKQVLKIYTNIEFWNKNTNLDSQFSLNIYFYDFLWIGPTIFNIKNVSNVIIFLLEHLHITVSIFFSNIWKL